MIQASTSLLSGLLSLMVTRYVREFVISPDIFSRSFSFLNDTYPAFFANLSGYILSNVPLYIGPLLLTSSEFGVYAFLDRLTRVFLATYSAVNQVLFRKTLSASALGVEYLRKYILKNDIPCSLLPIA
ncbi:hypothetical protein [Deinococcus irradiatisoli]|uniref:hypothetical protein n=1 Tax=Deinococcus irradiatisoli TaxID=2202254 RepID=UPI0011B22599|nr:hypothetical protein [Deinococcus irradiatisoli]